MVEVTMIYERQEPGSLLEMVANWFQACRYMQHHGWIVCTCPV